MTLALLSGVDLAAVAMVAAVMLVALRATGKRIEARVGQVAVSVEEVNRAVNHKPAGAPTLYEHAADASVRAAELADRLTEFTTYQHDRNHDLLNQLTVTAGRTSLLAAKVDGYVADDQAAHDQMAARLEQIEHHLGMSAEIDELGRQGRVERRGG